MPADARPARPVLLDGGLATQLQSQGVVFDTPLWSAELLNSNPRAIVDAHRAYLEAGAEILTSASYQASRAGFNQLGIEADEADRLIASSVTLAQEACAEYAAANSDAQPRKVAASVGPYGAVLNDGSEYTGDYGVPDVVLRLFHEPRLAVLDNSGADFLAVETIPSLNEAAVLAGLLQTVSTPAWISFCCRDATSLSDGAAIADAAKLFADHPTVFAVGVNCTAPQHIDSLIAAIRGAAPQKQVIVYPNSGERYDGDEKTWDGDNSSAEFAELGLRWFAAGADYVGGCCRVGPSRISALDDVFQRLEK